MAGRPYKHYLTNYKKKRKKLPILPYEVTKKWVQQMGFRSTPHFRRFKKRYKLPPGIPSDPYLTYGKQYEGDTIFFGKRAPLIMPFSRAQQYVRALGFTTRQQYIDHYKKHERQKKSMRLPYNPDGYVGWEPFWTTWGDFLGTGRIQTNKKEFAPYEQALAFMHQQNLKSTKDWDVWRKSELRPDFIPKKPELVYKQYWNGIRSWLGVDIIQALETRTKNPGVWCIVHHPEDPLNQYTLVVFKGGVGQARLWCKERNHTLIRVYEFEYDYDLEVSDIIRKHSSSFEHGMFTSFNFNQILFELDMLLLIVSR